MTLEEGEPVVIALANQNGRLAFPKQLIRARIIDRPNRFVANVVLDDGTAIKCHCPVTGAIGGFTLNGLPCLISEATMTKGRSTTHTLEAFALWEPGDPQFQWIGINQSMMNRYVEGALAAGWLNSIVPETLQHPIRREAKLGTSRIDFQVGPAFIEVKMPLDEMPVPYPPTVARKPMSTPFTNRLLKQVADMEEAMGQGQRAVLLACFAYDNPGFQAPKAPNASDVIARLDEAYGNGLESWQVNFSLDEDGVSLGKVMPLHIR